MTKAFPDPTGAESPKKVKDWVVDAPNRHSAPINNRSFASYSETAISGV